MSDTTIDPDLPIPSSDRDLPIGFLIGLGVTTMAVWGTLLLVFLRTMHAG